MKNALYVKTLAVAIAVAFLMMAGNGLGNNGDSELVILENTDFSSALSQDKTVDMVRIADKLDDRLANQPPIDRPDSTIFQDSFEDDVLGNLPDDPPWYAMESASTTYPELVDSFDDDTVGQNPNGNWTTVDGASTPTYWYKNCDDTTPPQSLTTYFSGYDGGFSTFAGDATLISEAWTGTAPTSIMGFTGGSQIAHFNEGVDTGVTSYFGPAGIDESGTVTTAYAGFWIRLTSTTQRADYYLYDYVGGAVAIQFIFFGGTIYHYPAGAQATLTTYAANTWYEFMVEYDETAQTYSVWVNGVERGAGSAWTDNTMTDINGLIVFGGDGSAQPASNLYIDHWFHGLPPTGGTHSVSVSGTWYDANYSDTNSVYMDQNGYAAQAASAEIMMATPYGYGAVWAVVQTRTSTTVANTNGATFRFLDIQGRTLMGVRFSGGNIQYLTNGVWTTIQPFTANTGYCFEMCMDSFTKRYIDFYLNGIELFTDAPLGTYGQGVVGFRAEATVSTQSEVYFDSVGIYGDDSHDGTVRVSNLRAHTGTQSVRMSEGGADTADSTLATYLGGDGCSYGEFWFWIYMDGTQGGGLVALYDTTEAYMVTLISLGADLSAANIPNPGNLAWVNGDGAGGGIIQDGPAISANAWHNISIRYDAVQKSFEARFDGALQGTFGFIDGAALDMCVVYFFGEGPGAPVDYLFDDIGLWVDDLPITPTNLHTYFPPALPTTEAWYTVDQDNAVQGTVTGTFANVDEIDPIDGSTENIQEASVTGGGGTTTYTYSGVTGPSATHRAYDCDVDAMPPVGADLNTKTEAATAEYTSITTSDNNRWTTVDPGNGDMLFLWSDIQVAETPAYITQIDMTFEGQCALATNFQIWALDATTSTWGQIGTAAPAAANTDVTITRSITANCANYISGGYLTWGTASTTTNEACLADLVSVSITYSNPSYNSLEHRWRTQNIPAGADLMELQVTARTGAGADDTFSFGYSTVIGGPYTPLITVNSDAMATYTASMPVTSGQFYINAIDSNSLDTVQDTLYVDAINVYWQQVPGLTSANEVATADNAVQGTVTGTYSLTTSIVPDASAQQIAETVGTSQTYLTQDFSPAFPPAGWTADANWGRSNTNLAGGTAPEAMFTWVDASGTWRLAYGPFDTTGTNALSLQFRHFYDSYDPVSVGVAARVQTSTDGLIWMNTGFAIVDSVTDVGPALATEALSVAEGAGSATLYVAFVIDGYAYDLDYWYVDSVTLTGTPAGFFATHRWTMQNMPLSTLSNTLTVTARTGATDETFNIGYAQTLAGPYTNLISVASTTFTTYTAAIPPMFDGSMYIQVKDTLAGTGDTASTSVYIDSLYVASVISPVNTTVNLVWDLSADDGAGQDDIVQYNVYFSDAEAAGTLDGTYNYLGSVPGGTNIYRHYGEAADNVNNIWYRVSAQDAHNEGAWGGRATKFNVAPLVTTTLVDGVAAIEIPQGTPSVGLEAIAYDDSSSWEDVIKMDGAEWFAGTDPGEGLGTALNGDGAFDGVWEGFTYTIDTSLWAAGNYFIQVRGHEAAPGSTGTGWGATTGAWINITGGSPPYAINLAGHAAGGWVFVSFPVAVAGNIGAILDDIVNGDSGTAWDVAKWYDGLTKTWMSYRATGTQTLTTVNNQMGVWLHLTANGGDTMLTLGMVGNYPAAAVNINLYTGWNMVGYPSATPLLASVTLPAQADIVSVWQAASPYISDLAPGAVTMSEGNAYWVHVTSDCIWTVNP